MERKGNDAEGHFSTLEEFRATLVRHLGHRGLSAHAAARMMKRRLRSAPLPGEISPHSFRVAFITDPLTWGVPLEDV